MSSRETLRRGIVNEGGFLSPYYLFELMARFHRDELDFDGREQERRQLPRVYRSAMARCETDDSVAVVWRYWYGELSNALGFELQAIADGVPTLRHGRVPVSHLAVGPAGRPLALVDLHPIGTDLDRDRYDPSLFSVEGLTREPIARAFELALDEQEGASEFASYGLLSNGRELRLYRRGGHIARQYLGVDFAALFDADRSDEWTAFWGLFRSSALLSSDEESKPLLERVIEESQRHASRIAEDLRGNVVEALEALVQGVLDERSNATLWGGGLPDAATLKRLFEEALYYLYRLLFVLYAESRDILPVSASVAYRDTYSIEHLREMAERQLAESDAARTYYQQTFQVLFRLLRNGFRCSDFTIPALGGHGPEDPDWESLRERGDPHLTSLFDGRRTLLLDQCRIPDRAFRTVVRELSLSRPKRRRDRRERYSYADLGVDQLGSVYEGLLVYEPAIVTEDTVIVKISGEERLVARADAEANELTFEDASLRRPGTFLLRLWGGKRKGSGSYYTPQEITSFLAEEVLAPQVEPIITRCASAWGAEQKAAEEEGRFAIPRSLIAEEVLTLKVVDPAMGSGAFLVQACRFLAEAYGRALIAEGRDESGRIEQEELLRYKRLVAERCLYGVDSNPLAVELAKVSVWLETLAEGRPLSFLDAHLRCGNSLLGAPLRSTEGEFDPSALEHVPSNALKPTMKNVSELYKQRASRAITRNNQHLKRLEKGTEGQLSLGGVGLDPLAIRETLEAYMKSREELEASDEGRTPQEALRLREEKEKRFAEVYFAPDSPSHRLRDLCDVWCAAWFWPEEKELEPITSEEYRAAATHILRGEVRSGEKEWYAIAAAIARERRFFHWEIEFPEVFLRAEPGFDAVLGNPPWEKVGGDVGELAGEFDAMLKTLRGDDRDARLARLLEDNHVRDALVPRARARAQVARFCRESPGYRALVAGEVNTFAPFTVLAWFIHRSGGALGFVAKDAFHLTKALAPLRAEILSNGSIRLLATSDNERKVFDAHNQMRFDILVAGRGSEVDAVPISIHRFRTAREIVEHIREQVQVPLQVLKSDDGTYGEPIPEIQDSLWPQLFRRLSDAALGMQGARWSAELHTNADKTCWVRGTKPKSSPGPVLAMVGAFAALDYAPMAWLKKDSLSLDVVKRKVQWGRWRIAVRDRADQKNERVMIAAVVPRESATCHYLNYCKDPAGDPRKVLLVASLANSLLLDYLARPFVGIHMSSGILNKMPWRLDGDPTISAALVREAARLTVTREEFEELSDLLGGTEPAISPGDRAAARARLDAGVARLYGLSTHEFARVLAWFRLLDQDQPALAGEPRSFITRDLVLLEFCEQCGDSAPADIVSFFAEAGVEVAEITGEVRDLGERVQAARELGAIGYLPSERKKRGRAG